jgi:hypothetical protein
MNMDAADQIDKSNPDFQRLKETAKHFKTLFNLAISSGPKEKVVEVAAAAKASASEIEDYTYAITVQSLAELMTQHAEVYDPEIAELRDAVNDLGLATSILIEVSILNSVVEDLVLPEMQLSDC